MPGRIITPVGSVERVDLRTLKGKVFELAPGKFRHITTVGHEHVPQDFAAFQRGEKVAWDDIDSTIESVNGKFGVRNAFYRMTTTAGEVGFKYESKLSGTVAVRLFRIEAAAAPIVADPRIAGNELWWDEIVPGIDIFLRVREDGVELFKKIKNAAAPRAFTWEIEEDDPPILKLQGITTGSDNDDDSEPTRLGSGPENRFRQIELLHAQTAFQTPKAGVRRYRKTETWTGRTFLRDAVPERTKIFFNDCVYPILIDVNVSETVAAGNDDGKQYTTTNWYSGANYFSFNAGNIRAGVRFQTVAIPQGATIDAASLTLEVVYTGGATNLTIWGNAIDDAPAFATNAGPANMTKTAASTVFAVPASGPVVVNVKTEVQEIVNRAGWASNNNMAFGSGVGSASYGAFFDFEGGVHIATLSVDYTAAPSSAKPMYQLWW